MIRCILPGGVEQGGVMSRFGLNRLLWLILAALSLVAAAVGVAKPSVYDGVVSDAIVPGVFTQDILAVVSSILLAALALVGKEHQLRGRAVIHGLLMFFFYAYGIYSIEQLYNWLYPLYLAIFGMSLFVLIYSIATIPREAAGALVVRPSVRIAGAAYGILIAVMFNIIWLVRLVPLIQTGNRIEFTFSIRIIDLSFVMPAFVIAAIMALRRHHIGLMGLPALYVLGVGILSPLALAETLKPIRYGLPTIWSEFWLYFVLSVAFLVFAAAFLAAFKFPTESSADNGQAPAQR